MASPSKHELYGGAVAAEIPSFFDDASQFRQVPDHQEVFVHQETGCCVIVELNSLEANVAKTSAAAHHFQDLAKANEAKDCIVEDTSEFDAKAMSLQIDPQGRVIFSATCSGKHVVAKFNEAGRENVVHVELGLFRIEPPTATDLLVTVSAPIQIDPQSSESHSVKTILAVEDIRRIHRQVMSSLEIRNWGLFVPE